MAQFASIDLDSETIYRLMIGMIVPRPIAWVTTVSANGSINLAPFSAFTYLSTTPPLVGISIARRNGALKDTALNIERTRAFVINIARDDCAELVHRSSAEFSPGISEVDELGLQTAPSIDVAVPRLAGAVASMECCFDQAIEFGDLRQRLVVGRVVRFHIGDHLVENGRIDTARLRPLARVAGPAYAPLGTIQRMAALHRPGHVHTIPEQSPFPTKR